MEQEIINVKKQNVNTKYIIKNCISCSGSGNMYFGSDYSGNYEDNINHCGHTYNGIWETHKCKECQGAGKVKYNILCKQL